MVIEYFKQAVHEDNEGNYARVFSLYMNALDYFKTRLKYKKNPKIGENIDQKFTECLRWAEEIRSVLDGLPRIVAPWWLPAPRRSPRLELSAGMGMIWRRRS
ncbi:hypothetical protein SAY87_013690 [Trapa incisa]|uniref:MIT domain-containing protein n=1 Tax=Trapa incisa TaxID=236973 RepID=A0AAN7QDB1_9MYRT|nr:hypothetical protein SAY87_013690 [Trapa incisa]